MVREPAGGYGLLETTWRVLRSIIGSVLKHQRVFSCGNIMLSSLPVRH